MMRFKVHDEDSLLRRIVRDLTRADYSNSYNLVVPPCFGEERLAQAACELIRREHPRTSLAMVAMDEIRDGAEFVRKLKEGWSVPFSVDPSDVASPGDGLQRIFGALSVHVPTVLIIRRFHKILNTIPPEMLGALRTAEQQRKVRALVLSPVSHRELKIRWDRERPLVVSDYGDSHTIEVVRPLTAAEFLACCTEAGVPPAVAAWFYETTGGYPELADEILGWWHRSEGNIPHIRRAVPEGVARRAERLVKWLDNGAAGISRQHVLRLFYRVDRESAGEALWRHEWREILLLDGSLRARAVGEAAVQRELHDLSSSLETLDRLAAMAYRSCTASAEPQRT